MNSRLALVALLVPIASVVAGCASNHVPIRARGPSGGMQGSAWELVVPGPGIVRALAAAESGEHPAYLTRRDAALGATTPSWAPVAITGEARPSIAHQRSVHLRRSHDSFLFFTSPEAWPAGWGIHPQPHRPGFHPHHHGNPWLWR